MAPDIFHSSALRQSLYLCGVFFLSVLIMFGFAYYETEEELDERMVELVREYDATMLNIYEKQGFEGLKNLIEIQSVGAKLGETLLYLVDKNGKYIAGNASKMEIFTGWKKVPYQQISLKNKPYRKPDSYYSFGRAFEEGHLILGRNNFQVNEMQDGILESLTAGFLISLSLTAVIGFFLARRNTNHLQNIKKTLALVADGSLNERIPVRDQERDDLSRVSKDINATLDRLSATVESLRQVSADIAHELKTPLQRLRQDVEILANIDLTDTDSKPSIERIKSETDNIIEIFQALLRISQIEAGARKSRFQKTDLADICEKVTEIFGPVAEDNHHRLSTEIQPDCDFHIDGDADLLMQMVTNLVENSITHCKTPCQIGLKLSQDTQRIILEVSDNGPGILPEERERVMERLYRLEKSRTTPGNGLGLSLVKAIADLHKFEIDLQDNCPGLKIVISVPYTP